jgi:hypothetical protein
MKCGVELIKEQRRDRCGTLDYVGRECPAANQVRPTRAVELN